MSAVKQSSLGDGSSAFNMARNGLTRGTRAPPCCESDCFICKANVPQEQGPVGRQPRDMDS